MSIFANTGLFNDVATQALRRYPFGAADEARLLQLSENATYLVVNPETGSKDGVLRVGRPGYHTLEEYQGEMAWLRQINDYTPLLVANPLEAMDGSNIQIVKGPDGKDYYCVICEFLEGASPDENDAKNAVRQYEALGETTAYLHRQTEIWNGTKRLKRCTWTYDTIIGDHAIWGPWKAMPDLTAEIEHELDRCSHVIKKNDSNGMGVMNGTSVLSTRIYESPTCWWKVTRSRSSISMTADSAGIYTTWPVPYPSSRPNRLFPIW